MPSTMLSGIPLQSLMPLPLASSGGVKKHAISVQLLVSVLLLVLMEQAFSSPINGRAEPNLSTRNYPNLKQQHVFEDYDVGHYFPSGLSRKLGEPEMPADQELQQGMKSSEAETQRETEGTQEAAANNYHKGYQQLDPSPIHRIRIIGALLFILTICFMAYVHYVTRKRQLEREREIKLRESTRGGIVTEEGLDLMLTIGRRSVENLAGVISESSSSSSSSSDASNEELLEEGETQKCEGHPSLGAKAEDDMKDPANSAVEPQDERDHNDNDISKDKTENVSSDVSTKLTPTSVNSEKIWKKKSSSKKLSMQTRLKINFTQSSECSEDGAGVSVMVM